MICDLSTEPAEEAEPSEPELICDKTEVILHEHTSDCFDDDGNLICGKIQVLEHQHTDACFTTVEEPVDTEALTCTLPEDENHAHGPLCYGTWELTCGLEEHTHSEACTPTEPETVYHCGTEAHTHSETCYDEAGELICGLEEHTHSLAAHSDSNADVETASIWAQTFAGVTLTGDWRQDVIAIAETQLGYTESTKNYTVWEDGSLHGYTRYGAWYGSPYGDWCAMFVSFCIHYAEVEDMPLNWGCSAWIAELEQLDQYNPADSDYSPAVGDLVFYDWDQDGLSDHMGLVAELVPASGEESAKLIAIEGNSSNQVRYVTYDLDDPVIMGYGQLPEQTFYCGKVGHAHTSECGNTCSLEEHIHSEECQSTEEAPEQGNLNMILPEGAQIPDGYDAKYSYIDPDNRFGVMVYASEDALPDNAVLSAELLEQGSEAYEAAQQALTDTVYDGFAALDIHFTVDGEEIEPESSVYVCINVMGLLPEDADADSLAVQHHEQTGTALLTPDEEEPPAPAGAVTVETVADAAQETGQVEALENSTETTADVAAAFEVESFSTFTITWGYTSNFVLNIHYIDTVGNDIAPSGIEKNFEMVDNTANVTMSNYADMIDHPGYAYQYAYIDNGGVKTSVNKLSYNTANWYFTTKITTDTATDDWTLWTGSDGKTSMDVYLVYQQIDMDSTVKVTWQNGAYALYLHYVDTNGNPLQIDASQTYVDSVEGDGNITVSSYAGLVYPPASYLYQRAYISSANQQVDVEKISYNQSSWSNQGAWYYVKAGDVDQWSDWQDENGNLLHGTQKAVDAYLVFSVDPSAYYYAQPIHDNIKLTLYDYGSYINTGDNKVIPFYQAWGKHSSIDGLPVNSLGEVETRHLPPTMEPTLNAAGYPQVSSGRSLEYLFRQGGLPLNTGNAENPLTKYADMRNNAAWTEADGYRTQFESMRFDLGSDGGLFHVDADGYYIYNCDTQSAYYNQDTNRFELSDTRIDVGHNNYNFNNFLPFNKIDPSLGGSFTEDRTIYKLPYSETEDKCSGIADLWFGMTMQVDFYMPSSGKANGKDMVFEFQGDDDVWVYIDDVLVLDIGGAHSPRSGSINFATGNVVYPNPVDNGATTINTTLKALFTNAGVSTASFGNSDTFIDWTEHTLKFYYMERGGNISSCHLKFNLPTRPEKTLQVSKTLTAAGDADAEAVKHLADTMEYKFRAVKADANGNPTNQLLIKEGDSYTISGAGLTTNETRTVGEDGYFTLKAGQMAEFADMLARFDSTDSVKKYVVQEVLPTGLTGQYHEVVYSIGSDTGTCTNDTTTVATDFTGYNSPAQEADAGNLVNYTNKVDTTKLSTLAITKIQVGSSLDGEPEHYYMQVQLGPDADSLTPISVGTTYFVGDETRSVEQAGIIKIAAGETAKVKLLAGTCYSVVEVADGNGATLTGSEGYTPAYSDNASGTVTEVGTTVKITVTNTFPTGSLELTKIVNNTATGSTAGEFAFALKFPVEENWTATDYTAAYTTTNSGQTHTGDALSFTKQDGNAVATVKLYHGEKVIITGLPVGAQVSITETNADGYSVGWNVKETETNVYGRSVACSIGSGSTATVTCTNTTGYELPNTGGAGTVPYTTGGFLLLIGAAFLLLYNHTKRRKEDSASS